MTIYSTNREVKVAAKNINGYLDILKNFLYSAQLYLSVPKCKALTVSTWAQEAGEDPGLLVDGRRIPSSIELKILGVTLQWNLSFSRHAAALCAAMSNSLNAIRCLASSDRGLPKEKILDIYKGLIRSTSDFACAAWSRHLPNSGWEKLQAKQNQALRIATGCNKLTPIAHLLEECQTLPVKAHCDMLTEQFEMQAASDPTHPCHRLTRRKHERNIRSAFGGERWNCMSQFELQQVPKDQVEALRVIHTKHVVKHLANRVPNPVLKEVPPKINPEERTLPRNDRVRLAQLRSGYRTKLNSVQHRYNPSQPDICRKCNRQGETVEHALACQAGITNPRTLWTNPIMAAEKTRNL